MKRFTKLFMTLALLVVGVGGVKAETISSDFSEISGAGQNASWSKPTMSWSQGSWNALSYFMINGIAKTGDYYDLSLWETITITFTLTGETNGVRVRMKDDSGSDGDWIVLENSGSHTINITDFKRGGNALNYSKIAGIQLSGGNSTSGPSTATFTEISIYRDNPLEKARTNLEEKIALAEKQNPFGKTETSFTALTNAINTAKGVKDNNSATLDELTDAISTLQEKIDALELLTGYYNLTTNMYKEWEVKDDNIVEKAAGPGTISLFKNLESGNVVYGNIYGSGDWQNFADLSGYSRLYVTGTPNEAIRGYFNKSPEGTGVDDITLTFDENGIAVFDFENDEIFADNDSIRLIFLKAVGANSGITSLLLNYEYNPSTDTDPGIPEVSDGWVSLITNGKLDGTDVTSFWTKTEDTNATQAVIDAHAGRADGYGIKVVSKDKATNDYGTQFFIKSSEYLKAGQKVHIEFDYRADRPASANTQAHRNPGDYNSNISSIEFALYWKHFNETYDVTSDMGKESGFLSFAINLNGDRNTNNFYFDNIVMWTEDDPLKPQRVALQNAIALGNAQSDYLKTTDSFGALTNAISQAEGVVNSNDETTLTNAKTAIENAIKGLKLVAGYTNLTANMYKRWNDNYVPTTPSAYNNPIYVVGASTGQPYGDGSVQYLNFADITEYSKLILTVKAGTPRIMMNRLEVGNGSTDSNGGSYVQLTDAPVDGVVEVDLTAYDYAHLNAIKGANYGNVTVSDMLLYRTLTISGAGWATFGSLDKSANLDGANVYAAKYENGSVKLTVVDSKNVPAGVGVLVEGEGEIVPTFDVEADEVESDLKVSNGTVTGDGSTIYVLANGTNNIGFYLLESGVKVPAGKAYLEVSSGSAREFIGFGDATAIKSVETVKANGTVYNLAGQQVKNAQKGVFIVNGKKVIK